MLELGVKVTLAYLLGAVLGSLVIGALCGIDIRNLGSGNPGGTNALRTQGKAFALGTMIIDVGKGILAAHLIPNLPLPGIEPDPEIARPLLLYCIAFAAIAGHVFPVWFGFRGGKGGATAAGLLVYFEPWIGLVVLGAWVLVVLATGYVGLATMTGAAAAAVVIGVTRLPEEQGLFLFALAVAALLIYAHRSNLRRMLDGTESRFTRPTWVRFSAHK